MRGWRGINSLDVRSLASPDFLLIPVAEWCASHVDPVEVIETEGVRVLIPESVTTALSSAVTTACPIAVEITAPRNLHLVEIAHFTLGLIPGAKFVISRSSVQS